MQKHTLEYAHSVFWKQKLVLLDTHFLDFLYCYLIFSSLLVIDGPSPRNLSEIKQKLG